jgi:hypothetical protein
MDLHGVFAKHLNCQKKPTWAEAHPSQRSTQSIEIVAKPRIYFNSSACVGVRTWLKNMERVC